VKKAFVLLIFIFIAGCGRKPLTRAEVIKGIAECKEAGLQAQIRHGGWPDAQVTVWCVQ